MLAQGLSHTQIGHHMRGIPMKPGPYSPVPTPNMLNMQSQRAESTDSAADAIRKRVCKACDRCRLKKSKCDGSHPCSRCKADNAICVFGERKKSHDKIYPKGYVEMLEQQQGQLVSGLQEMYHRLLNHESWTGPALTEMNGHPLTHDILAALELLETKHDDSGELESFEEDCQKLQSRLIADGASYVQRRRDSLSSDSEQSQHGHTQSPPHRTPAIAKQPIFNQDFTFSASPSPVTQSPVPRQRQSYPPAQQPPLHGSSPLTNDPQLFEPQWSVSTFSEPEAIMRSRYAMRTPRLQDLDDITDMVENNRWDEPENLFDLNMDQSPYSQQFSNAFPSLSMMQDFGNSMDPMEVDFQKFIQVAT